MRGLTRGVAALCVAGICGPLVGAVGAAPPPAVVHPLVLAATPVLPPLTAPVDATAATVRSALSTAERYFLDTWWHTYVLAPRPWIEWGTFFAQGATLDSFELRRYSSVAFALAVPIATGAHDPVATGASRATATDRVVTLVQLMVRTHTANLVGRTGWGGSWQSSLWAAHIGLAGWLVGAALPEADRLLLARMLEYEVEAVVARPIHYYRDREGRILTPGDSGAEEVGWDTLGQLTAIELLPYHPRRAVWAEDAYRRLIAAYSRPQDVRSPRLVNGRALRDWLGGSNADASGFVTNHNRHINPDYTLSMSLHGAVIPALVGEGVPTAMLWNHDVMYRALATTRFVPPVYRSPGGVVYVPGSAALYYPSGPSWGTSRQVVYGTTDIEVAVLGLDRGLPVPARRWAGLHFDHARRMQGRFSTGQMFGPVTEDSFYGREEYAGALLAHSHLFERLGALGRFPTDHRPPWVAKRTRTA